MAEVEITIRLPAELVARVREHEWELEPLIAELVARQLDEADEIEDTPNEVILENIRAGFKAALAELGRPIEVLFAELDEEMSEDADPGHRNAPI